MQPVRSADYPAHPSFAKIRTLPDDASVATASAEDAHAAWTEYLGWSGPLFLLRNSDRARRVLMEAFGVEPGELVGVPVNTRRYLSEAVKKTKGKPLFV